MKIALTGASGFLGRHVLAELSRRDVDIILVTRNTSSPDKLSATIPQLRMDLKLAEDDIFDRLGRPDVLIHLAWDGLPHFNSPHHMAIELPGQHRFLSAMLRGGLKTLLASGTCLEYGMQSGRLSEEFQPRPTTWYGIAKNDLNQQLTSMNTHTHFNLIWCRLFYMYGEGQSSGSLYPSLIKAIRSHKQVFNLSAGDQLRDYLPVTEVAQHLVYLALKETDTGIVNICSGKPISIKQLVTEWAQQWGSDISFNFGYYPYPDYEPHAFWGDSQRLQAIYNRIPMPKTDNRTDS